MASLGEVSISITRSSIIWRPSLTGLCGDAIVWSSNTVLQVSKLGGTESGGMELQRGQLKVVAKQSLTLYAGWWEEVENDGAVTRIVHPSPSHHTLFHQVVAYLDAHSLWNQPHSPPAPYQEALAATAVCLRWGSYLAVLADRHKPLDPRVKDEAISHLSDGEMRRINVEASAALAEWIGLRRQDALRYNALVYRALEFLPFARYPMSGPPEFSPFLSLASRQIAGRAGASREARSQSASMADMESHPSRVFANALVKYAWYQDNPVEGIRAGSPGGYPLTRRRIGPADQERLLRVTASRMLEGVLALVAFQKESGVAWSRQVMPYHPSQGGLIAARDWTLTEATCEFRLPGPESAA